MESKSASNFQVQTIDSSDDESSPNNFEESQTPFHEDFNQRLVKRRRQPSLIWEELLAGDLGEPPNTVEKSKCKHCHFIIDHHKHISRVEAHLKKCSSFTCKINKAKNGSIPDHLEVDETFVFEMVDEHQDVEFEVPFPNKDIQF